MNRDDSNQMLHSVAYGLGLNCLVKLVCLNTKLEYGIVLAKEITKNIFEFLHMGCMMEK